MSEWVAGQRVWVRSREHGAAMEDAIGSRVRHGDWYPARVKAAGSGGVLVFIYGDDPEDDDGEWAGGVGFLELPLEEADAVLRPREETHPVDEVIEEAESRDAQMPSEAPDRRRFVITRREGEGSWEEHATFEGAGAAEKASAAMKNLTAEGYGVNVEIERE